MVTGGGSSWPPVTFKTWHRSRTRPLRNRESPDRDLGSLETPRKKHPRTLLKSDCMKEPMKIIKNSTLLATAGIIASISGAASADVARFSVAAKDFGRTSFSMNIQDLYLSSADTADTALNLFNSGLADAGQSTDFQSFASPGWQPNNLGGPFNTAALRNANSFVVDGGFVSHGDFSVGGSSLEATWNQDPVSSDQPGLFSVKSGPSAPAVPGPSGLAALLGLAGMRRVRRRG